MRSLLPRAIIAFIALPGMVAFVVPLLLARSSAHPHWVVGLAVIVFGSALLLWCVRDFYVSGRGTLAPWSPPQELVTVGLYRYSRNPMYVAVLTILIGWALYYQSRTLALYALGVMIAFNLRVRFYEEPFLERTHGEQWIRYSARVRRWL